MSRNKCHNVAELFGKENVMDRLASIGNDKISIAEGDVDFAGK